MKTLNKLLIAMAALALMVTTSCLDDSMVDIEVEDFAGSPYIADFNEMPNSAGYIKRSFQGTTDPTVKYSASFRVNLSSPWQLDEDLQVTVKLDEQAVQNYIANKDPEFQLLSSDKYNFTETTVTIPAGEREVEFSVDFAPAGLSADDKYMVAFSIVSTSNPDVLISGNYGTQYVQIGVTNVYDGTYTVALDWIYGGNGGNYGDDYTDWAIGTGSSVTCIMDYFYPYWNYPITITVDAENPQTIDGHDNAYAVTLDAAGKDGDDDKQLDDYEGGVWNYCYQQADGKWVFKLAHALTTGSGTHVGSGVFVQN